MRDVGAGFPAEDETPADRRTWTRAGSDSTIIRALSDEVEIESNPGGSRLRFVKYLS